MTEPTNSRLQERDSNRFDLDLPDSSALPESPAARAAREPLFNKKVMALWATGALALWFMFSVVIPAAIDAAKESVREAVTEAGQQGPDGRRVITFKNGKTIIITKSKNGITITRGPVPGEATAAPIVPPVEPAQPEPAAAPKPAAAPTPAKKK